MNPITAPPAPTGIACLVIYHIGLVLAAAFLGSRITSFLGFWGPARR